jgi:hypothetical protein
MSTTIAAAPTKVIRDYRASDYDAVKAIHEASGINYKMPNLSSPLFVVTKVVEIDGVVIGVCGAYLQAELYLWLSKDDWGTPQEKLEVVKDLDRATLSALWDKGIDQCVLYLPPGMDSFRKRLEDLGYKPNRDGWVCFSKETGD